MPRRARLLSSSNVYHIVIRGTGKQIIFEEPSDFRTFIRFMREEKEVILHPEKFQGEGTLNRPPIPLKTTNDDISQECRFKILAYCLMNNHVHLLIQAKMNEISYFMKVVELRYVIYFNKKYNRSGTLFQGRFGSFKVQERHYFFTVYRYILRNPVKAGLGELQKYPWNSFGELKMATGLVDVDYVVKVFGSLKNVLDFVLQDVDDEVEDISDRGRNKKTDEKMLGELCRILKVNSGTELQEYSKKERNEAICRLIEEGFSMHQIERLTGISYGVVFRAWNKQK